MTMIYCVEDDASIRDLEVYTLCSTGFAAQGFRDGKELFEAIHKQKPELIVLDIMLPGDDGVQILHRLKNSSELSEIPVIMATAKSMEYDKIKTLDMGADDYLTKPFGISELMARIRTALRHNSRMSETDNNIYKYEDLTIDFEKRLVLLNGEMVHLTQNEYKIVVLLAKNAGRVLTYDAIITQIWGPHNSGDNRILRVNMANIRRKFEKNPADPHYIFTEVGTGYRMAESEK